MKDKDSSNEALRRFIKLRGSPTPKQNSSDEPVLRKPMYTVRLIRSEKRLWMEISEWRKYLRSLPDPNQLEYEMLLALNLLRAMRLRQRSVIPVLLFKLAAKGCMRLGQHE
jgi:hypothetical protein